MRFAIVVLLAAIALLPVRAGAITNDNFLARTTADMVELCTAGPDDDLADEAVHFCQGYLIGAFHYYRQLVAGPEVEPFVCLPSPPPSRNEGIQMFVEWANAHPQYMGEPPVETLFRFLTATWPCPD